jgi:flavin-dependent dehydrogenase
MHSSIPVVIVGGGPAGSGTAIALRNEGINCALLEKSELTDFKPGETIPPNARPILLKLGIARLLEKVQHETCLGNLVIWGDDVPRIRYYLSEPSGNGWHINRSFFEDQLHKLAIEKGTKWLGGWSLSYVKKKNGHFIINAQDKKGRQREIESQFVVDASGRASILARKLGVGRIRLDRLTAYCALVEQYTDPFGRTSFIETVTDGWWYAAPLANEKIVLNFMTDVDLHSVTVSTLQDWMFEKLQQTKHLKKKLIIDDARYLKNLKIKPVNTSCLEQITGEGWLAVGDSACMYDPVSSFGLTSALGGSLYAAQAIKHHLDGNLVALDTYCSVQQNSFNRCMLMLMHHYKSEQRWCKSLFWQRRHEF